MEAALGAPARGRMPWTTVATLLLSTAAGVTAVLLLGLGGEFVEPPLFVAATMIGLIQVALAFVVVRWAPGHPVAPLLAAMGAVVILTNAVPIDRVAPVLGGSWMLLYLPLALVLIIMPSGRPASARWRAVAIALCLVVAAFLLLVAAQQVWPGAADMLGLPGLGLLAAFFGLLVACATAPFVRYRSAGERDRVRLRWVLAAGLSLPLTLLLCWTSYLVLGAPDLVVIGLIVMLIAIPGGAVIALVRPQLFDVDRATIAIVTFLALCAAGLVVLTLFSLSVGQPMSEWPTVPAAITAAAVTLAGVVAFPFASRGFDLILFPDRGRAISGLRQLSRRVDSGSAPPEQVQEVLRGALRDPGLVVVYRRFGDRALVGLDGRQHTLADTSVTVRVRGEEIGAIIPSPLLAKRPATAIARAAAPLVDAIRSRSELTRTSAEVEASRERLLRAGYEERRRLERDLHDGAQQRLVALGMQLRVLQRTAIHDHRVAESLDVAVAELGTAVAELRRLAHGVRPSALDDGLGAALADLERLSPDVIELDVRAGELPDAVAITAYFVVNEAVANALRHAGASRIRVHVRHTDDVLRVRVADDGCGGAAARATGGLTGLTDRVGALGGSLRVDSAPGAGTVLEAMLPCAS